MQSKKTEGQLYTYTSSYEVSILWLLVSIDGWHFQVLSRSVEKNVDFKLTLVHVNDIHAHIDEMAEYNTRFWGTVLSKNSVTRLADFPPFFVFSNTHYIFYNK